MISKKSLVRVVTMPRQNRPSRASSSFMLQRARRYISAFRSSRSTRKKRSARNHGRMRGGGVMGTPNILSGKFCAPGQQSSYTCFDKRHLIELANEWNRSHQTRTKTKTHKKIRIKHQTKRQLWTALQQRMMKECDSEFCWVRHPLLRSKGERVEKESFRPRRPVSWKKKPNDWLSNVDILRVLEQYESIYEHFLFIGPVPIDFEKKFSSKPLDCVSPELCQMNLQEWWDDGVRSVGIVFNLDPHDMSGSHWVALYVDLKEGSIQYYDSYGMNAPDEVRVLMSSFAQQGNNLSRRSGPEFRTMVNRKRHQFQNSECGVYCIHFITHMLEGGSFEDYVSAGLNDRQMQSFRSVFYNPLPLVNHNSRSTHRSRRGSR